MRAYLGFASGLVVPRVLARVDVGAGRRGWRRQAAADRRSPRPGRRGDLDAVGRAWPVVLAPPVPRAGPDRAVPGPDVRHLPGGLLAAFIATTWVVTPASDRMASVWTARRSPPAPRSCHRSARGDPGPGDGLPLVLHVDGPTIGGYPVIGVVPRADLPRLGQVRPGDSLRFVAQDADAARAAWRESRWRLAAAAEALGADAVWERLEDNAGG
jgi:antagonist of KipI